MKDNIMRTNINDDNYFDDVDWNAPSIKHPLIEQLKANRKAHLTEQQTLAINSIDPKTEIADFFDGDVQEAIRHHNTQENRIRVNAVLRALFATA